MLVIGTGIFFLTSPEKEKPSFTLPDGRVLRLERVTFGTNHMVQKSSKWRQYLRTKLPRRWHSVLGPVRQDINIRTEKPVLVPWMSIEDDPKQRADNMTEVRVHSDSGEVFRTWDQYKGWFRMDGRRLFYPAVEVFDRRAPTTTLKGILNGQPWSLRFENPLFREPFPEWNPRSLPATNHAGDLTFVLQRAALSRQSFGSMLQPYFKVYRDGKPAFHEYTHLSRLKDATGNQGIFVPTNGPAWEVEFELKRLAPAPWKTNEFLDVAVDSLPAPGEHSTIEIKSFVNGHWVERLWLGGPGFFEMSEGRVIDQRRLGPKERRIHHSSQRPDREWDLRFARLNPWLMCESPSVPRGQTFSVFLFHSKDKEIGLQPAGLFHTHAGTNLLWMGESRMSEDQIQSARTDSPFKIRIAVQTNFFTRFVIDPAQLLRLPD